ncbi:zinc finger protein 780B-like [Belonocnema kinseyi]|uniref:zinc finger protein 780B-like n=1 Tax=Belonocnema kinseyi TaxID=2817044 RepID=UPI00143CE6DD|nr:zinc finger protein 780B-like [Belonocnema kinseyi]
MCVADSIGTSQSKSTWKFTWHPGYIVPNPVLVESATHISNFPYQRIVPSNAKYFGSASKKPIRRPHDGPYSALHSSNFLEFETIFWSYPREERNLSSDRTHSNEKCNAKHSENKSKKSRGGRDAEPYSALHCDHFMAFKTVFLTQEREELNLPFKDNPIVKTLIEYDTDETLDIKQDIIQDQETKKVRGNKVRRQRKTKIQNPNPVEKYKCKKCARSYNQKESLYSHQKFECGVVPQFKYSRRDSKKAIEISIGRPGVLYQSSNVFQYESFVMPSMDLNYVLQSVSSNIDVKTARKKMTAGRRTADHYSPSETLISSVNVPHKPFNCPKCGRSFAVKGNMNRHLKYECGRVINELSKNLRDYPTLPLLKGLGDIWVGKRSIQFPFRCDRCGKQYQHRTTLQRHTRHECGKEPRFRFTRRLGSLDGKYSCTTCGKTYKWRQGLLRHRKYECNVDPMFHCKYCSHRSRHKDNLMKHIFAKHVDRRYYIGK